MCRYKSFIVVLFVMISYRPLYGQKTDTLLLTPDQLNTKVLREGKTVYLVYFKTKGQGIRKDVQFWSRTVQKTQQDGRPVFAVTQDWEYKDTILHTAYSVCDGKTLQPLTHNSWWRNRGTAEYDFVNKRVSVNGMQLSDADTARQLKTVWKSFKDSWSGWYLNWHLDLEMFSVLPYRQGLTILVPFYESGYEKPEQVAYTVAGSASLHGYDDRQVDCWLLSHESPGNKELFWVSKKTREVLKMEQVINGTMYRYKVRLGFAE